MGLKDAIKPITYLKNHTADLVREVAEQGSPVVITQNGRARVVVLDVDTYDRWCETMAFLKVVAQGESDVEAGRVVSQDQAYRRARTAVRRSGARGRR